MTTDDLIRANGIGVRLTAEDAEEMRRATQQKQAAIPAPPTSSVTMPEAALRYLYGELDRQRSRADGWRDAFTLLLFLVCVAGGAWAIWGISS